MNDIGDTAGLCSILIPVYNGERFLKATVESALAQDYPNTEIVLIDDCSNDSSPQIISEIVDKHKGIVFSARNADNIGVGNTLRRGLGMTRGNYVVLMGQDDLFGPGFISKQVMALEESDAVAVFGSAEFIDGNGKKVADLGYFHHEQLRLDRYELFLRLLQGNCLCAPAAVIRNDGGLSRCLGYNNDRLQDFELWLSLLCRGRLYFNETATLWYRVHEQNFSRPDRRQAQVRYEYYSSLRRVLFSEEFNRFARAHDDPQSFFLQVVTQLDGRLTYSKPLLLLISEFIEHKLLANELDESDQVKATLARIYKRMGMLNKSMVVCPHEYPERLAIIIPDRIIQEGLKRFVESNRVFHGIPRSVIRGEVNERYLWLLEGSVLDWELNDVEALKALYRRRVVVFCRNEEMLLWRRQVPNSPVIDHESCLSRTGVERAERTILSFMEDKTDLYDTNLFSNVPARSGYEEMRVDRVILHDCREVPRLIQFPGDVYDDDSVRFYGDGQEIEILSVDKGSFLLAPGRGNAREYRVAFSNGLDFKSALIVNNEIYTIHGLELDHTSMIGHAYPVCFRMDLTFKSKDREGKIFADGVNEMMRRQELERHASEFIGYLKRKLARES